MLRWLGSRRFLAGWLAGLATVGLAGGVFAAGVLWGGWYDTGADNPHLPIVAWAVHSTMTSSVRMRAGANRVSPMSPPDLVAGARLYEAHCIDCHGGPGVARSAWVAAMLPTPPYLIGAARQWSRPQLDRLVRDGVKMTGMPAWGEVLPDRDIVRLVDFIEAMPQLDSGQFARLRVEARRTAPVSLSPSG
jgi:mono/diheme cytochrome c family protein